MHPDHQYIESLRRNDPAGIRAIYQRYAEEARLWVLNNNGSEADARDVFQEAIMTLYEKARQPDFVLTCPLGALLHVLYSRKWIDRLRQKKRESAVRNDLETRYSGETDHHLSVLAEEMEEEAGRQNRLARAFEQLSELCRNLLRLLAQGVAPAEAALQLQLNSVDTLYRRKNACAQRWRALYFES